MTPEQSLSILEPMTVFERTRAIWQDIDSGEMNFARLNPFDLAHLLDVPGAAHPTNLDSWHFVTAAEVRSLEVCLEEGEFAGAEDLAYLLRDAVDAQRLEEVERECDAYDNGARSDLGFLNPDERESLEMLFAQQTLNGLLENGIGCTASYCVRSGNHELWFHATIEDDGSCHELRTPYDGIAGPVPEESDPNYVCETW